MAGYKATFRLGFLFCQMSLELVVRNSFVAVELFYPAMDLCADGFSIL